MTAKLTDRERERRLRDRRQAREIVREAELLAFRKHHGPEEFPGIIVQIERSGSPPAHITPLRRALYRRNP
jgi:hypothetical protein